ncbi:MAG TPA: MFS transporter, partial [Chryseolinea sp.]|nr:MFS transporter [Chryseolinea sp.]
MFNYLLSNSDLTAMKEKIFTRYEVFVVVILSVLQFTVVLDFMVLSPLGAILMPELKITPSQFGMVVSAYAFSAGASGLLAAGFADKFDRKKLLLFFYGGFIIGTLFCALAPGYQDLLLARIITGIFGGVISSIGFAIITDLFKLEVRGRVMGYVQMAFASSQVLGIPVGLYLANEWGWHSPFFMIVALSGLVGILIIFCMRPIDA